jgi:hypothetical protein
MALLHQEGLDLSGAGIVALTHTRSTYTLALQS